MTDPPAPRPVPDPAAAMQTAPDPYAPPPSYQQQPPYQQPYPPPPYQPQAPSQTAERAKRAWAGLRQFYDDARPAPRSAGDYGGRRGQAPARGANWVRTEERFRDPGTGKIMRVWIDPADQSRHYLPEDER
jgi:hypothetical protein